jgi:hypothetical protein
MATGGVRCLESGSVLSRLVGAITAIPAIPLFGSGRAQGPPFTDGSSALYVPAGAHASANNGANRWTDVEVHHPAGIRRRCAN